MSELEVEDFEDFVAARTPALLRTAYLLTGDQQLSEDLVQTALERALPQWGRRRVTPATESYVRTIMYRENISIWRRRRGRETPMGDLPEPRTAPAGDQVEDQIVLRAALLRLGARQRTVLVLRYYEDLTEAQVAQVMGVSVGTVKSQTSKALDRLRRASPDLRPGPVPRREARLSEETP